MAKKVANKRNRKGIATPTRAQKKIIKKRVAAKYPEVNARTRTVNKGLRDAGISSKRFKN